MSASWIGMSSETSPHTRGKPLNGISNGLRPRNIPAYAGKTFESSSRTVSPGKHPRIRGENYGAELPSAWAPETSPHTRGKLQAAKKSLLEVGNIPAYAGKTPAHPPNPASSQKHPRIRGENPLAALKASVLIETSPHTRGKLTQQHFKDECSRNIPAYAGKTIRFG